jgi:hypothetical protein
MLQSNSTNILWDNHLTNILLALEWGLKGTRGCRRCLRAVMNYASGGGGAVDEQWWLQVTMNPCLRHRVKDSSTTTSASTSGSCPTTYWASMQQLGCPGIAPSFPKLQHGTVFTNILLIPLVCIILTTHIEICMWRAFSYIEVPIYVYTRRVESHGEAGQYEL